VHVVVPSEHPTVVRSIQGAFKERGAGHHWHLHQAAPRFVAGQSHAVLELIEGRPNLPVTTWTPAAVSGLKGHPTLLSNAETFAQLAYAALRGPATVRAFGRPDEPGTRLLTLADHAGGPLVVEVEHGTPWSEVLTEEELNRPVLIGGYHGGWLRPGALANRTVSPHELDDLGVSIGAGVVIALRSGDCPLHRTAELVRYLADQSAHRCGPCFNGLPALADALHLAYVGDATRNRTLELIGLVTGRGACAHPDGTARLATSLLSTFGDELTRHAAGTCGYIAEEELAG
jgi:NADH:ubiquinone oxidoreductase subunit F (NADH-binding)